MKLIRVGVDLMIMRQEDVPKLFRAEVLDDIIPRNHKSESWKLAWTWFPESVNMT